MTGRINNPDPNPIRFGGSSEYKEEEDRSRSSEGGPVWPA